MRLNSYVTQYYRKALNNPVKFAYVPLVVYWIILFILTTIPTQSLPAFGTSDKVKHFGAYLILSVLFRLAAHFSEKVKKSKLNELSLSVIIIALYGVLDEIHQYFIPGRYCDLLDLTANFIGLAVGILLAEYIIKTGQK